MSQERFTAIRVKTQEVLARAKQIYGVDVAPTISFNLRGRTAGIAGWKRAWGSNSLLSCYLKFNQQMIVGNHFEDIRDNTVAHEVAHLVCAARPELGKNHDYGWKTVCLALGGNGKTRHDYDVQYVGGGFTYRATCGTEITVSRQIHRKIQAGQGRLIKKTRGRINKDCAWAPQGQTLPTRAVEPANSVLPGWTVGDLLRRVQKTRAPMPTPAASVSPRAGASKAGQVREFIRQAKREGLDRGWAITNAIAKLDMNRGQAIRYVTENWERA